MELTQYTAQNLQWRNRQYTGKNANNGTNTVQMKDWFRDIHKLRKSK